MIKKFDKEKGFRLFQENVKAFPEIISLPEGNMQQDPVHSDLPETKKILFCFPQDCATLVISVFLDDQDQCRISAQLLISPLTELNHYSRDSALLHLSIG